MAFKWCGIILNNRFKGSMGIQFYVSVKFRIISLSSDRQIETWTWNGVHLRVLPGNSKDEFTPVSAPHPTLLTPPPLPMGILYSPQFLLHQETKMATHWTERSTYIFDLSEK